jgi:hypothetical protein
VDYDNDGKIDPAVFRPGAALYIIRLASGTQFIQMGDPSQGDLPIPGDYDGDGKTDLAVFRPGSATWIIRPSNGAPTRVFQFGDPAQGDLPIQAPIGTLFRRGQLIGGRLTIQSVNTTTPSVEIATTGQVRSAVATATAPYHQAEPSQASQVPLRRSLPGQESVAASRPWHRRGGIWKV